MATIPLPALHIAPQQEQPGPLDAYAKLLQLRNLQAQGQTQQLNQTALSQENQQRALQLQDAQTLRSLAPNHIKKDSDGNVTGFDMPGLLNEAAGKQVNPNTLTQMGNQYSESVKNLAASDEATRNNELAKNKASYELLESVRSLKDPAQQQQAYQQGLPKLQKLGIDTSKMPPQAPTDPAAFDAAEATLGMHAQALADAKTTAETAEKQQQTATAKATQAHTEMETAQGGTPEMRSMNDWLAKNPGKGPSDYEAHMKTIVPAFNLNLGGLGPTAGGGSGPSGEKTLNDVPANLRANVKAILDYRSPMPAQNRNNPMSAATRTWVQTLDPTYDETTFPARNKILTSFTSGPESKSINAINTALGHLGELKDAADAASQNNIPLLHSIASKVGAAVGQDAPTTYNLILHRVSPELTAAYVQGGGGEGERGANEADFALSKGASQINSNLAESAKLLRSKISAQENQWSTTFKPTQDKDKFENRFITPAAKATLDKLSSSAAAEHKPGGQAAGLKEGQTGTGSDGKPYIVKGGVWVPK